MANDDLISRQAAINSQIKMIAQGLDWVPVYHLEQLPSAERRGRWILRYGDGHIEMSIVGGECSLCGFVAPATRYCPYCGARMDGEEE